MSCTFSGGNLKKKTQRGDRKAFSLAVLWKAPLAEAAGPNFSCLASQAVPGPLSPGQASDGRQGFSSTM